MLRRLADGLHRHHIGAVSIMRGVQKPELGEALRALAAEADRDGPLGLKTDGCASWPHVKLHPLTFDGLALVGDAPWPRRVGAEQASRGAELWVGLARAALASDGTEATPTVPSEPSVVARAIDEHPAAPKPTIR